MSNKDVKKFQDLFHEVHKTSSNLFVTNVKNISIDRLVLGENVRKYIDEELIDNLANSIQKQGLLQPIIVKPGTDNKYLVIAGQRRYLACKKIGMESISCCIINADDEKVVQLVENLQRENLNLYDKAKAIQIKIGEILGESGQEKVFSKLFEIKNKTGQESVKINLSLNKDILEFLSNIGLSIANAIRLVSIFNFDEKTQMLISKYNPPVSIIDVCYKYRKEETFPKVFEEILKRGYTIIQAEAYLKRKFPQQKQKDIRRRYYSVVKSLNKKIDELPSNLSEIKDKDKVVQELQVIKEKIEMLLSGYGG
jgi:ParB/RepB/Spo0J family partition protein